MRSEHMRQTRLRREDGYFYAGIEVGDELVEARARTAEASVWMLAHHLAERLDASRPSGGERA